MSNGSQAKKSSVFRRIENAIGTIFVHYSPVVLTLSIGLLAIGGALFGYYQSTPSKFASLAAGYRVEYDIILAINDPFGLGLPWYVQVYAVLDAIVAYLILPSLVGLAIGKVQEEELRRREAEKRELLNRLEKAFKRIYTERFPGESATRINDAARAAAERTIDSDNP